MKAPVLAIAAILAAAPVARADNALRPERIPNKARELADKGRAYHQAGDYAAAVAAFKEAYVLAPSPGLLFNIAQSYRLAGDCDEAAWMYRRFLDTNPGGAQ
ncbi:MAG TPA: tetratricopeptide repeat protein, partial [Kofleriaceae bacterium]|nr:tetratricopeptide repeat protein [Kofleriaceae bacterium]